MNRWDVVLLVVAGYLAVMGLVRLMIRRRDQLLGKLRHEVKMKGNRKEGKYHKKRTLRKEDKAA
ncbi:MAG: hypothetical protein ABIP48_16610 [Planctomycetota bacterium]